MIRLLIVLILSQLLAGCMVFEIPPIDDRPNPEPMYSTPCTMDELLLAVPYIKDVLFVPAEELLRGAMGQTNMDFTIRIWKDMSLEAVILTFNHEVCHIYRLLVGYQWYEEVNHWGWPRIDYSK